MVMNRYDSEVVLCILNFPAMLMPNGSTVILIQACYQQMESVDTHMGLMMSIFVPDDFGLTS